MLDQDDVVANSFNVLRGDTQQLLAAIVSNGSCVMLHLLTQQTMQGSFIYMVAMPTCNW